MILPLLRQKFGMVQRVSLTISVTIVRSKAVAKTIGLFKENVTHPGMKHEKLSGISHL